MKVKNFIVLLFLMFFTLKNFATHIVGGEIYYDCLGNNNYKITLKIYRDCNSSTSFDHPAVIGVYDATGILFTKLNLYLEKVTEIPPILNNCYSTSVNVCVEEGIYSTTVVLPPKTGGYSLSYQRCCRNADILNITNADEVGATYQIHILDSTIVTCNSTPRYVSFPPLFICAGAPLSFDHAATDPDGDSLFYEICNPFEGADKIDPQPDPPSAPPYLPVNYNTPYSGSYPMNSSPILSINKKTGLLTGTPRMIGRWVVGVCVSEYRNGKLLTTNKRDFQFNVVNCETPTASIPQQTVFCTGYQVDFTQSSSNSTEYFWNFGDTTTVADTSIIKNPTWTYPSPGTYTVTLIVNPRTVCADTAYSTFQIQPLLKPEFIAPPDQCLNNNKFNFMAGGSFVGNGSFTWNFGASASPSVVNLPAVDSVFFSTEGNHLVTLTVTENGCTQSYTDTITVLPVPKAKYTANSDIACNLQPVYFTDSSIGTPPLGYRWSFGDGTTSTEKSPVHVYKAAGTYLTSLIVNTESGCVDTFSLPTLLAVYALPVAGFNVTPKDTSIFYPTVNMIDTSKGAVQCSIDWGDGTISNCDTLHHYDLPGKYKLMQIVVNAAGCYDTAYSDIIIHPEFLFWVPNAFTPYNGDGINDVFKPKLIGVHDYRFMIFNRWGDKIFETTDRELGWDGYVKGNLCQQDVYVYKIIFKDDVQLQSHEYVGKVILVK